MQKIECVVFELRMFDKGAEFVPFLLVGRIVDCLAEVHIECVYFLPKVYEQHLPAAWFVLRS